MDGGGSIGRVVSLTLLGLAGAILLYAMWLAGTYTLTHSGPPCSNPPQRDSNPTQLVVVGLCLLSFALGHLSNRWQPTDPKHLKRHFAPKEPPEKDPRRIDSLIIQALLLTFLLEVVGLLIIEMTTLSNGVWPITYYVRCSYDAAGWPSAAAAAAILFLVGRWFWLPGREKKNARPGA